MEEFVIGLSGELLSDETIKNIKDNLKEISKELSNDLEGVLRINGYLNVNQAERDIQDALDEIAKNLKFDIGDNALGDITKALQEIGRVMSQTLSNSNDGFVRQVRDRIDALEDFRNEANRTLKVVDRFRGDTQTSQTTVTQSGFITTATTEHYSYDEKGNVTTTETSVITNNLEAQAKASVKARNAVTEYTAALEKLRLTYIGSVNERTQGDQAKNPILDPTNLETAKTRYNEIYEAIQRLGNLAGNEFAEAQAQVKAEISTFNTLLGVFEKVESMGTQLRDRPIEIIKEEQSTKIEMLNTKVQELALTSETSLSKFGSEFTNIGAEIEDFKTRLQGIGSTDRVGMEKWLNDFGVFQQRVEAAGKDKKLELMVDKAKLSFEGLGAEITQVSTKLSESNLSDNPDLEKFNSQITAIKESYDSFLQSLNEKTNEGANKDILKSMTGEIKAKTDEIKLLLNQAKIALKGFKTSAKDAFSKENFELDKSTFSNQIQIWLNENTAASEKTQQAMRNLQKQIQSADKDTLKNLKKQFQDLKKEATATGEVGKSFFDTLKSNIAKFTGWYGIGNAISSIRREITGAVSDLKEMDTLLTEISKTSNRTEADLQALGQSAYSAASNYGRTVQDYLSGVLEMSRAGYSNAEAMAELSLKAQSAGDMTAELANQYLIATDAAYQLKGSEEELSNILNSQNKITNLNAVSMTELAEATKIAASQSASAGVGVDEMTAAIGTMIATTQQSGSQIARAWRSILMSIRQTKGTVDEETGEIIDAEKLSKAEKAANALGVSLKEIKNGTIVLRDSMTVLRELSEAYNELDESDTRRANLLNDIAGKYRSNAFDSLLKNFDTYEKMLQEFSEGTNSAAEEAEKTANSWEGSLNKFNNSVTELVNNFVNSGNAKSVINFFTGLVQAVNKTVSAFGSLGTAIGVFAGIMASKSKSLHFSYDKDVQSIKLGETALKNLTKATVAQNAKTLVLTASTKLLNAAISVGTSLIIGGIVSAISSWINKDEELQRKQEEELQKLKETNEQYKENTKNIEENIATYKKIMEQDSLSESDKQEILDIQNQIIDTYGRQAEGIDLVNGKYQEQLNIMNKIASTDYQKGWAGAISLLDKAKKATEDNVTDRILTINAPSSNTAKEWGTVPGSSLYRRVFSEIEGFTTSTDSLGRFLVDLDNVNSDKKVEAITEALRRLNEEALPYEKDTQMYQQVRDNLEEELQKYSKEVDEFEKIRQKQVDFLVKGLTPSQLGVNINWYDVTEDNFNEWYDAVISYYKKNNGEAYTQAVQEWFERNYPSYFKEENTVSETGTGVFGFSYDAYKEEIDAVTKEFKNLQSVIEKIDSGKYSVIEDGFGLLDVYPELLKYINNTDVLRQKLVKLQSNSPQQLISDLQLVRDNLENIGDKDQIAQIDALIEALQSLGDTAEETAESLTAKDYLKIQQDGIDRIVDKLNNEKDALNNMLDTLNDRKSEIEDYYDAQINALKEENSEREKNIELQEKQKALDDAKKNKVRVYSAVKGFTIQEDSEAVAKAQQDLDSFIKEDQINKLEKQKDAAVNSIEEEIKAQKKEIKAKEDEIDAWKDYKTQLTNETNAIIDQNAAYLEAQKQFVLDENSTFKDREQNLKEHLEHINALVNQSNDISTKGAITDIGSQLAIGAIMAMYGLSPTEPIPQADTSNNQLQDFVNPYFSQPIDVKVNNTSNQPLYDDRGFRLGEQTNNYSPNTTYNITANTLDESLFKKLMNQEIESEYSRYIAFRKATK